MVRLLPLPLRLFVALRAAWTPRSSSVALVVKLPPVWVNVPVPLRPTMVMPVLRLLLAPLRLYVPTLPAL